MRLTFIIILATMLGCGRKAEESRPTFETPQPNGKRNINGLPKKWIGQYAPLQMTSEMRFLEMGPDTVANSSDTLKKPIAVETTQMLLSVYKDLIIETEIYHSRWKLDSIGRIEFNHDTAFIVDDEMRWKVHIEGDSIFQDQPTHCIRNNAEIY